MLFVLFFFFFFFGFVAPRCMLSLVFFQEVWSSAVRLPTLIPVLFSCHCFLVRMLALQSSSMVANFAFCFFLFVHCFLCLHYGQYLNPL